MSASDSCRPTRPCTLPEPPGMALATAKPVPRVACAERPAAGVPAIAVLLALAGIALWSTNALAGSAALGRLPVSTVVFVQCATATVALGVVRHMRRRRTLAPLGHADWRYALVLGGLGFGGTIILQYLSFAHAPIVEANIIAYGWPMFAAVWLALGKLDRHSAAGLLFACVGFAGVAIIAVSGGGLNGGGSALGYAAALGSAVCMAFYSLGSGRARVPALDMMLCGAVIATLASAVLMLGSGVSWAPTVAWLAAAYIGLGPCAAGYALWSAAMARTGGRLAPIGYATPLLSTIVLLAAGRPVSGVGTVVGGLFIVVCTVGVVVSTRSTPDLPPCKRALRWTAWRSVIVSTRLSWRSMTTSQEQRLPRTSSTPPRGNGCTTRSMTSTTCARCSDVTAATEPPKQS